MSGFSTTRAVGREPDIEAGQEAARGQRSREVGPLDPPTRRPQGEQPGERQRGHCAPPERAHGGRPHQGDVAEVEVGQRKQVEDHPVNEPAHRRPRRTTSRRHDTVSAARKSATKHLTSRRVRTPSGVCPTRSPGRAPASRTRRGPAAPAHCRHRGPRHHEGHRREDRQPAGREEEQAPTWGRRSAASPSRRGCDEPQQAHVYLHQAWQQRGGSRWRPGPPTPTNRGRTSAGTTPARSSASRPPG